MSNRGTITAAVKKLIKYIAADALSSSQNRNKILILIGSVIIGFLGMMMLPIAVLFNMSNVEIPDINVNFDRSEFISSLSADKQQALENMMSDGKKIEDALSELDLNEEIIKAQLIYFSFFENDNITDITSYAELFKTRDNSVLIENINKIYDKNISYEDLMRTYTMIMNRTINEYMFTDPTVKNVADLAAWARNSYVSGWGYKDDSYGETDDVSGYRCADNVGLILGYLNYQPDTKQFDNSTDIFVFDEIDTIDAM